MNPSRQEVFQRLRTPCVELSSVALRFKAGQVSQKALLLALEPAHNVLKDTGQQNLLDEKLAEYAFFPLTHIFNQSRQLSSQVLHVAVQCVQILVSQGWKDRLSPELARQLLLLMCLMVGSPSSQQSITDELKSSVFDCIATILHQLSQSKSNFLDDVAPKSIVDQLVYQILEDMTTSESESVQLATAHALSELQSAVHNPILLASLLPRTISSLVKVLRPSTQARRSQKVFGSYLNLMALVIKQVLDDSVVSPKHEGQDPHSTLATAPEQKVLDQAWLKATAPQVDMALTQVTKLRHHNGPDVTEGLVELCLVVIESCPNSLSISLPLMVETLIVLCRSTTSNKAQAALDHLLIAQPDLIDIMKARFLTWSQALPRVMLGNDDRPKQQMLGMVATSYVALAASLSTTADVTKQIASVLVDSVSAAVESGTSQRKLINDAASNSFSELMKQSASTRLEFDQILLDHQSQRDSALELRSLISLIRSSASSHKIIQSLVEHARDSSTTRQLAATWLALEFLKPSNEEYFDVGDFLEVGEADVGLSDSRPFLISDLYAFNISYLLQHVEMPELPSPDWRQVAFSMECLILQAAQLGRSYRPELMETLYPLLTLFSSRNAKLQSHAVTALDLLSRACEYKNATEMLIDNVDYLINAIALRLNTFDVSEDGIQVLCMMVQLCGARLLPHLDDLIGSIFGALDNYHGYPQLVERLFSTLSTVVDESAKAPALLAIEAKQNDSSSNFHSPGSSAVKDIFADLQTRSSRNARTDTEHEEISATPQRPWKPTEEAHRSADDKASEDEPMIHNENGDAKAGDLSTAHRLLIRIAESTVPHMSSPSPRVRLTILDLLRTICPILSVHENSFLPLVNKIWPAIEDRLLEQKREGSRELPYNTQAAIDTIGIVCENAGHFMSSRIEEIFSDLESLFTSLWTTVKLRKSSHKPTNSRPHGGAVGGAEGGPALVSMPTLSEDKITPTTLPPTRTSEGQILEAVVKLLVTILSHVRLSEDNADRILDMLAPVMVTDRSRMVRNALVMYNDDFVWLFDQGTSKS
ncbi:hypothetical protein B0A52_05848 [Exophiala mesophila]|uniref:Uncharacterized protein n=1 Tax=Exophiala mesophila TaxID=212818 RepID=A0A438N3M9_EXOME|nr:hypothetical protein B0A52_05848 [Exophiala mesophila]